MEDSHLNHTMILQPLVAVQLAIISCVVKSIPWQHYLPRFLGYNLSLLQHPLRCCKGTSDFLNSNI